MAINPSTPAETRDMPPRTLIPTLALILTLCPTIARAQAVAKAAPVRPTREERAKVVAEAVSLSGAIDALKNQGIKGDRFADVDVYRKAAVFMDRLDEYGGKGDAAMVLDQIETGLSRAQSLGAGAAPWTTVSGSVVRGYVSKVDGSTQPYAVEVPRALDRTRPARLDVVLHGRNAGLNESRFIKTHEGKKVPDDRPTLTLHVFGRTNNAYRWAGETDVYEAIDAVKRNYPVDDDRIVLRGFSMGGAGAWHLGLHDPSRWSSVEAGAGFSETIAYTKADPKAIPPWRRPAMTIYDSVDYALNAFDVPIIGYGGEVDTQLQASTNIIDALKKIGVSFEVDGLVTRAKGLDFRRVVGKGMGHKVDPASQALLDAFHDDHARAGLDRTPKRIRFVTYTLAYKATGWISVERMAEHYKRTTVDAELSGESATIRTEGVAVLGVDRQVAESLTIDGTKLPLRLAAKGLLPKVYYRRSAEGWEVIDHEASIVLIDGLDGSKNPAVHGPIDDAFRGAFLVVTPTGTPWHPEAVAWTTARLDTFRADWERYLRGNVRVKRDVDVTGEDIAENHLILFGDPGSNALLAKVLKGLPVAWTKEKFILAGDRDPAKFVPVFLGPNPLNPRRYVVVNTGHTFEESDFKGTNALLYPRLGDWAVIKLGEVGKGEVETSGYFDERWRVR